MVGVQESPFVAQLMKIIFKQQQTLTLVCLQMRIHLQLKERRGRGTLRRRMKMMIRDPMELLTPPLPIDARPPPAPPPPGQLLSAPPPTDHQIRR